MRKYSCFFCVGDAPAAAVRTAGKNGEGRPSLRRRTAGQRPCRAAPFDGRGDVDVSPVKFRRMIPGRFGFGYPGGCRVRALSLPGMCCLLTVGGTEEFGTAC